jgi:centromeric protein E
MAVKECFDYVQQCPEAREYLLRVSMIEVYKERIRDLLVEETAVAQPVRLFDTNGGLIIKGLHEEVVTSPEQVVRMLEQGDARRHIGSTNMNLHSSRSHVIVRIWIESRGTRVDDSKSIRISSLSLVDLAGSESVKLSGSTGERRKEGQYINQSLMTLGKVVYSLSEGEASKRHIPYRDSKLTRLLQPSLSGDAQVVLICCISPLEKHIEESHSTFKFALRAKKIPQQATIHEKTSDDKTLLESYREEIEDLRNQLRDEREQQTKLMTEMNHIKTTSAVTPSTSETEEVDEEISELVKSIQNMERLILKSKPVAKPPEDSLMITLDEESTEKENVDTTKTKNGSSSIFRQKSPRLNFEKNVYYEDDDSDTESLKEELSRVQELLGTVMKKQASWKLNDDDSKIPIMEIQIPAMVETETPKQQATVEPSSGRGRGRGRLFICSALLLVGAVLIIAAGRQSMTVDSIKSSSDAISPEGYCPSQLDALVDDCESLTSPQPRGQVDDGAVVDDGEKSLTSPQTSGQVDDGALDGERG